MLIKLLALVGVFFVIYIMFFKKSSKEIKKSDKKSLKGDTMIECNKCETFVSEDEAIIKDAKFYCSKKCAGVR